jgi:cell division protein FtsZ
VNEASTLIQEAAHEDANIIFGAVIDDTMPKGEMRVTVIATGLDSTRMRVPGPELDAAPSHDNVTPLRREPAATPMEVPPAAQQELGDFSADTTRESELREQQEDFISPFPEDELDVPTFIRKGGSGQDEDEEEPAFLRRSAD